MEGVRPPSTLILVPVTYDAAGEARKATMLAISSAFPNLAIGMVLIMFFSKSGISNC